MKLPWDCPLSPVVANMYMERFEQLALKSKQASRIWKRYVDDTFCVIDKTNAGPFLYHLNSLHPTIQFIMELKKDGRLAFRDTLMT